MREREREKERDRGGWGWGSLIRSVRWELGKPGEKARGNKRGERINVADYTYSEREAELDMCCAVRLGRAWLNMIHPRTDIWDLIYFSSSNLEFCLQISTLWTLSDLFAFQGPS